MEAQKAFDNTTTQVDVALNIRSDNLDTMEVDCAAKRLVQQDCLEEDWT